MSDAEMMQMLAAALAAFAAAGVAYALFYPYFSGEREKEERMRGIVEPRSRDASSVLEQAAARRKSVADSLKEMEAKQKAAKKVTLRIMIQQAGLSIKPRTFWLLSLLCGVISATLVLTLLPPGITRMFLAVVIGLVGVFGLPRWILNKLINRRRDKFIREFPNAIDIVVRGMKSGLPLNECLAIIARESQEPLAGEFREVIEQQRVGVTLSEALERLTTRMPLAEVRFLAIVIAIQQQAGGNLSEALGNLSGVIRDRFHLKMKVKALSAEAKASALVLASLPPGVMLMVYGSSPGYIAPLFNTTMGNFALLASGFWMLMGVLTMRKMINFKF